MARPKGGWTPQKVRERIRTGLLVKRLMLHAVGKLDITPSQMKATEILLRKTLPDLSATEHSGEIISRHANELSDAELADIAASSRAGTVEAPRSTH